MKKIAISTFLLVLFCTLLPCGMKGQERVVVPMPNRYQLQSAHVRVLFQDSEGYMWYGMKSDGLYRDDGYELTSFRADFLHPEVQMNNNIMCLCEDRLHRIWIGTKRGLYILDKRDYSIRPTGDKTLQIWTFDALKASVGDSVWAYANKQLLVYDLNGNCISRTPYDENPLVTQSRKEITDLRGNVWKIDDDGIPSITAQPLVMLKEVDLDTLSLRCMLPSNTSVLPPEHRVHYVWAAENGTKWIGTNLGLWRVRPDCEPEQVGPNFGVVNTLAPAEDGTVYMNTEWQGLISYKDEIITRLDTTIRNATDVFLDKEKLWICTADGRLMYYDVKKGTKVDKSLECRLQGDAPAGIVVMDGMVWLLFNQRLLVYSPERNVIHYIFPSDLDPQPKFFRRLYTDGKHRIFLECESKTFEMLTGRDAEMPKNMSETIALSAYETYHGIYCLGLGTHHLDLAVGERVVHLFFTTFDYLNTKHIRFAVRRSGEEEWQYLEMGENDARIPHLAKGENVIEVMATDANGEWSKDVFTITVYCPPYWWETVWAFIAFGVVAVIMLVLAFFVWRKVKSKRSKKR